MIYPELTVCWACCIKHYPHHVPHIPNYISVQVLTNLSIYGGNINTVCKIQMLSHKFAESVPNCL